MNSFANQVESENGNDHRAGTIDLNFKKHTQVRLRVHRIVIWSFCGLVNHDISCIFCHYRMGKDRFGLFYDWIERCRDDIQFVVDVALRRQIVVQQPCVRAPEL